jgi:hypothetical protein
MTNTPDDVVLLYYVVFDDPNIDVRGPYRDPVLAAKLFVPHGGKVVMVTASPVTHGGPAGPRDGRDA